MARRLQIWRDGAWHDVGKKPSREHNVSVQGGFRAGKRKRGNSLQKRKPREAVTVIPGVIRDSDGNVVAGNVRTITYRPPTES